MGGSKMERKLEKYIKRAEDEELGKEMRPEAVEALKVGAKAVYYAYPSLEECLMGTEIYEEAEKHYFEEEDEFPLKYISALKSIAMMADGEEEDDDDDDDDVDPPPPEPKEEELQKEKPKSKGSKKRPSKRRQRIEKEVKKFVKEAEEYELEKEMREEGVNAVLTAANTLAYKKKYFDMNENKFKAFPSVCALLVNIDIYEEAEKYYYDPEDEFPLKYIAALKEVAITAGGLDEDLDEMETMAVEITSEDELFAPPKKKNLSVKDRLSVFEKPKSQSADDLRRGSVTAPKGNQYHPLISPPLQRKKRAKGSMAFQERLSLYKARPEERKKKMERLESVRRLNEKGLDAVEGGMVGDVVGRFNDQMKDKEEAFQAQLQEMEARKKRLREQKEKIRERKRWRRSQNQMRSQIQAMAKKKKLLADIVSFQGSNVWSNVRAQTLNIDHTSYQAPQNLPAPTEGEEKAIVDAMKESVLFDPHREIVETRDALVHAFEKFNIPQGEEFIQGPEDNFFYVVEEGSVDLRLNGKVIGSAKKGEHFGELNLLYNEGENVADGDIAKPNLIATKDSILMRLNQENFREILQVQAKRDEDERKTYLKKVPFLRNLLFDGEIEKNKNTTNRLVSIMHDTSFGAGDQLLVGDPEDSLYIIKEGKVQLTSDKNEVFHLGAGSYIGKRALMSSKGKEPNVKTLEGLSEGTLFRIEKEAVNKVLGQNYFSRQFDVAQDKKKLEGFQCIKSVNLDPETMDEIAQNIEDKQFEAGNQILTEGSETEPCLYLVRQGYVTLSTNNGQFKQKVGPGGYFGVEQLLIPKDKNKSADASQSKKVLVPAQWSVSVPKGSSCVVGVLPLEDVQNVLDSDNQDELLAKLHEETLYGDDTIREEDDEDVEMEDVEAKKAEKKSETEEEKAKQRVKSAADTSEGQLMMQSRIKRKKFVQKSVNKLDSLEMISVLGDGEFGEVWLVAAPVNGKDEKFALKKLKKDADTIDAIEREIAVTDSLCHPNVAELVHTFRTDESVFMLLGLVPGGELWELIYREDEDGNWNSGIKEANARFYSLVVADTLAYLHSRKYLYRDLKPENVMIDKDGYPVLVDFGFAKHFDDDLTFTFCGTPNYVAPEIVKNVGHNAGVDHWALGVLIYEMLSGEHPFFEEGMHQMEVFEGICQTKHYPLSSDVSEAAISLIDGLLEKDRTNRLGSLAGKEDDILGHKWFDELDLFAVRSRETRAPWIPSKKL